ncbi:MAG: isoamylase early set domain-containing protein [Gemmatimonadota bacterium]
MAKSASKSIGKLSSKSASTKKRVTFTLESPQASQVCVAGTFNDWDPTARALKKGKDGVWTTWMNLAPGKYEYRFVIDGEWCQDPACADSEANEFGSHNSVVKV